MFNPLLSLSYERISELLNYIIKEPPTDANDKRAYRHFPDFTNCRYPFIACELLCCDSKTIAEYFFIKESPSLLKKACPENEIKKSSMNENLNEGVHNGTMPLTEENKILKEEPIKIELLLENKQVNSYDPKVECELLEKILSFLKSSEELNLVLCGYFSRIMDSLAIKRQIDLWNYLFEHKSHLTNILRHCNYRNIAVLLCNLMKAPACINNESLFNSQRREIIYKLLNDESEDITMQWSLLWALSIDNIELPYILNNECIARIYSVIMTKKQSKIKAGLKLLISLMETSSKSTKTIAANAISPAVDSEEVKLDYSNISQFAIKNMGFFKSLLEENPKVFLFR